jgi:hypothetical protein
VLAPGCTLELQQVRGILERVGLARQKFPERLVIVDELPKTPSGKVRNDLCGLASGDPDPALEPAPCSAHLLVARRSLCHGVVRSTVPERE